ncbi:MAG: Ldh family oxidoreductase [Pseudomonadota bacterium]
MDTVHMTLDEVHALTHKVLIKHGCDDANATAIADNITGAERDTATSHGVFRLPGHVTSLSNGKVNGQAKPTLERLSPGVVKVDSDGGFTPLAFQVGKQALIEAARENGIAVLAITRTFHFAALWPETSALAEEGLVALAVTSSPPYVAAAGGKKPFFGTNPMAFAWPRKEGPPMAFDQAAAAMARGEIMIHARDGHEVPDGVGIDADGNPTNDPDAILKGAQLTFGGYKGSAIALMIDLLAGPLIGEAFSAEAGRADNGDGGPALGGELIIAIDPKRLGAGDGYLDHAEQLFAEMTEQPGVRLPGDRRLKARAVTPSEGVHVPKSLHAKIVGLAEG